MIDALSGALAFKLDLSEATGYSSTLSNGVPFIGDSYQRVQ